MQEAKFTVKVIQLFLTNCVKAHDNCLEVLLHINLYLSTRRPRTIGSHGHVNSQFFEIMYFQEFCHSRPEHFFQKKSTKNHQKNLRGAPHPLLTGLGPSLLPRQVLNVWPQWCWITRTVHFARSPSRRLRLILTYPRTRTPPPPFYLTHCLCLSHTHKHRAAPWNW